MKPIPFTTKTGERWYMCPNCFREFDTTGYAENHGDRHCAGFVYRTPDTTTDKQSIDLCLRRIGQRMDSLREDYARLESFILDRFGVSNRHPCDVIQKG